MDNEAERTTPDPVAVDAAKYALEVTEPSSPHPWVGKILVAVIIFVVVVGTFGAVIGTINSVSVNAQNKELKIQQECQKELLSTITKEQQARVLIAADDRTALRDLVTNIANAGGDGAKIQKALSTFNRESRTNDIKRNQYPVPTFASDVCNTTDGQKIVLHNESTPTSTKTSKSNKSGTSSETPSKPNATPTPTVGQPGGVGGVTAPAQPKGNTTTKVTTRVIKQPNVTRTVVTSHTATVPQPASSTPGLINIPGCDITLVVKVC